MHIHTYTHSHIHTLGSSSSSTPAPRWEQCRSLKPGRGAGRQRPFLEGSRPPGQLGEQGEGAHAPRLLARPPLTAAATGGRRGLGSGDVPPAGRGLACAPPPPSRPSPRAARGARRRRAPASRGISPPARRLQESGQLSPARSQATPDRAGTGVWGLALCGLTFSDVSPFSASAFGPEWPALRKEDTH